MRLRGILRGQGLSVCTPALLAWKGAALAAILFLGVAGGFVWMRSEALKAAVLQSVERENQIAGRLLSHGVGRLVDGGGLVAPGGEGRWIESHQLDKPQQGLVAAVVRDLTMGTAITKVRLFNRAGAIIFSTVPDEVGRRLPEPRTPMFISAAQNAVQTMLDAPSQATLSEDSRKSSHIAVTYHPFHRSVWQLPDGVIEVEADVTRILADLRTELRRDAERVIGTMLALYLALVGLIGWGTRILTAAQELAARRGQGLAAIDQDFRAGIESMADGFLMFDADLRVIHWNQRYIEFLPHMKGALVAGMSCRDVMWLHANSSLYGIPEAERPAWVDAAVKHQLAADAPEVVRHFSNGSWLRGLFRKTHDGGLIVIVRDITAEADATRALAESERRFRDFAAATGDWLWELDAELRFSYLSDASTLINGMQPEQLYGSTPMEFRPAGVSDQAWADHVATITAHLPYKDFRFESVARDGTHRTVSVSGKPIFDEVGNFRGYRGVGADITQMVTTLETLEHTKSLAESNARLLREGIESMQDAYIMLDAEAGVVLWNSQYAALFPHLRDLLRVGLPVRDLAMAHANSALYGIPVAERAAWVEKAVVQILRHDQPAARRELANGQVLQGRISATSTGSVIHVIRDITKEMLAQQALAGSEAEFRDGIESMADGFIMFGADARIIHWNNRYVEIYPHLQGHIERGMTDKQLLELHAESQAYGLGVHERTDWVDATLNHLADFHENVTRTLSDGRVLNVRGMPTQSGGRIYVISDVTAETKAKHVLEQALSDLQVSQETVRRLALVAQHTDNVVIISDARGRIEWVNPAFTRISGYTLEEVAGRDRVALLQGRDTDPTTIAAMRAALDHREGFHVELLNYTKSSQPYWLEIDCAPVKGERGEVEHFVAIEADVTQRKLQEKRLADALEREREVVTQQKRFVSVAAHEFRTPLTIIDGAAQRLLRYADQLGPDDLRERAQKIRGAVTRMMMLIDTTLNMARIDEGQIALSLTKVDVAALLTAICRRQESIATDFTFTIAGGDASIMVQADPRLLDQVFTNLLSNAVKYSGKSRRIEMRVTAVAERVEIAMRDFGIGVPADELPKLFTRFYRASTARGLPGTGIGLSLVKELVRLHGGEISVTSRVGEGTIFTVVLPVDVTRSRIATLSTAAA